MQTNQQVDYWHDEMTEEVARRVLGSAHFDFSVTQGAAFCKGRAAGAWQANDAESFGAYHAAARVAKRAQAALVLDAFDRLRHSGMRDQRERAAEVRRNARNRL